MPNRRLVTGVFRTPDGTIFANKSLTWFRNPRATVAQGGAVIVDEPFVVQTNGAGEMSREIEPGSYLVMTRLKDVDRYFDFGLPEGEGAYNAADGIAAGQPVLTPDLVLQTQQLRDQALQAAGDAQLAAQQAASAAGAVQGFLTPPTQAQLDALPENVFRIRFLDEDGKTTALVRSPGADKFPGMLGWVPDVEPALYDQGTYLANYAGPAQWWDGLCDDIVDSTAKIYAAFDAMQAADPDYVTSSVIGTDDAGNEIRQYTFFDNRMRLGSGWAGAKVKTPEICIIAGVHGNETEAMLTTIHLAQQLVFHARFDDEAMRLRLGVKFRFVPAAVPTAINARQRRKPVGDVDINRNFPSQWFDADITTGSKGSAPASEIETQILMTLPELFPDCDVFLDFHSHVLGSTYNQWMGVFDPRDRDLAISHMREFLQRQLDYGETYPPTDFLVSVGTAGGLVRHYNLAFGRKAILLEVWRDSREWTDLRRMKLFRLEWVKSLCAKLMLRINVDRQNVGNVARINNSDPFGLRKHNPSEFERVFGDVPNLSILVAPEFADGMQALNLAKPFDTALEDYQRQIDFTTFPNSAPAFDARFSTPDRIRFIPLQGGVDPRRWTAFAVVMPIVPSAAAIPKLFRPNLAFNDETALCLNVGWFSSGNTITIHETAATTEGQPLRLSFVPTTSLTARAAPSLLMFTFSTERGLRIFDGGEEVAVDEADTRPLTAMINPGEITMFHNFHGRAGISGLVNTDLSAPENTPHLDRVTDFLLAKYGIPAGSQ